MATETRRDRRRARRQQRRRDRRLQRIDRRLERLRERAAEGDNRAARKLSNLDRRRAVLVQRWSGAGPSVRIGTQTAAPVVATPPALTTAAPRTTPAPEFYQGGATTTQPKGVWFRRTGISQTFVHPDGTTYYRIGSSWNVATGRVGTDSQGRPIVEVRDIRGFPPDYTVVSTPTATTPPAPVNPRTTQAATTKAKGVWFRRTGISQTFVHPDGTTYYRIGSSWNVATGRVGTDSQGRPIVEVRDIRGFPPDYTVVSTPTATTPPAPVNPRTTQAATTKAKGVWFRRTGISQTFVHPDGTTYYRIGSSWNVATGRVGTDSQGRPIVEVRDIRGFPPDYTVVSTPTATTPPAPTTQLRTTTATTTTQAATTQAATTQPSRSNVVARPAPTRLLGAIRYAWNGQGWYRVVAGSATHWQIDLSQRTYSFRAPGAVTTTRPVVARPTTPPAQATRPPVPAHTRREIQTSVTISSDQADTLISSAESIITMLDSTAELTEEQKSTSRETTNTIQEATETARQQYQDYISERDEAVNYLAEVDGKLNGLDASIATLQGQVEQAKKDIEAEAITQDDFDALDAQLQALLEDRRWWKTERSHVLTYIHDLVGKVSEASQTYQDLLSALNKLRAHDSKFRESEPVTEAAVPTTTVVEEEADFEEAKQESDKALQTYNEESAQVDALANTVGTAGQQLTAAQNTLTPLEERLKGAEGTLEPLTEKLKGLADSYDSLSGEYQRLFDKLTEDGLEGIVDEMGDDVKAAVEELKRLRGEFDTINTDIGAQETLYSTLSDDLRAEKARIDEAIADYQAGRGDLTYEQVTAMVANYNDVMVPNADREWNKLDGLYKQRQAKNTEYDGAFKTYDALMQEFGPEDYDYRQRLAEINSAAQAANAAGAAYNAFYESEYKTAYDAYQAALEAYRPAYDNVNQLYTAYTTALLEYQKGSDEAIAAYDAYLDAYAKTQTEWRQYVARESSHTRGLPRGLLYSGETETARWAQGQSAHDRQPYRRDTPVSLLAEGARFRVKTVSGGRYRDDEYVTVVGFNADGTAYYRNNRGNLTPITEYVSEYDGGTRVRDVTGWSDDGRMITGRRQRKKRHTSTTAHADGSRTVIKDGYVTVTDPDGNVVTRQPWGGTDSEWERHQAAKARGEVRKQGQELWQVLQSMGVQWDPRTMSMMDLPDLYNRIIERQGELDAAKGAAYLETLKGQVSPEDLRFATYDNTGGMPTDDLLTMTPTDMYEAAIIGKQSWQIDQANRQYNNWERNALERISPADRATYEAMDDSTEWRKQAKHEFLVAAVNSQVNIQNAGVARLNEAIEQQNQLAEIGVDPNDLYQQENIADPGIASNTYIVAKQTKFIEDMQKHGMGDLAVNVLATDDPATIAKYETFVSQLDALADATQQQILTGYDEGEYLDLGGQTDDEVVEGITQALRNLKDMGFEDPTMFLTSSILPADVQPSQIADYITAVGQQALTGYDPNEFTPTIGAKTDDDEVTRIATWLRNKRMVGLGDEALGILSLPASEQPAAMQELNQQHRRRLTRTFDADERADIREAEQLQIDARLAARRRMTAAFDEDEQANRVEQIANQQGLTGTVVIDGQVYYVTPEQQQAYDALSPSDRAQLAVYFAPGVSPARLGMALLGAEMDGPMPKTPAQLDAEHQENTQAFIGRREGFGDLGLTQSLQIGDRTYMVTPAQKEAFNRLDPADQAQLTLYFDTDSTRLGPALTAAGMDGPIPRTAAYWGVDPRAVARKNIADAIDEDRLSNDPVYLDNQINQLSWVRDLNSPRLHTSSPEEVLAASERYGQLRTLRDGPNWIQNDDADARDEFRQRTYLGHDVGAPFVNLYRGFQYSQGLKYGQNPATPDWAPVLNVPFDDAHWRVDAGTPWEIVNPAYGYAAAMVDFGRDGYTENEVALLVGLGLLEVGAGGIIAKTPRGLIKLSDAAQAAMGRRLSEIAVFYGSNPIPVNWRNYVPPKPNWGIGLMPLPTRVPIAGGGRVPPLGALRVRTDAFGELVQPGGAYDIVRQINPGAAPSGDTLPFFRGALDSPGTVSPVHDSARQILDTLQVEWDEFGQPFVRDFPILADDGTDILSVSYNPSPAAKALGDLAGSGPVFHSSPSAMQIVGDIDEPLSMLGDIGAPSSMSPSMQDILIPGRSGVLYEMPLPIKEYPTRVQGGGWEYSAMPLNEQGGFSAGGTGILRYVDNSAFDVGSMPAGPGIIAVNPQVNRVQVSPAPTTTLSGKPKTSIEFEGFTPIGDPWVAPRTVPDAEAAQIVQRAEELYPNNPAAAAQAATEEIARREGAPVPRRRDVTDSSYRPQPGDRRPSSAVVILDPTRTKVAMARTSYGERARRGKWQFPGGLVDPGEQPWQSAIREGAEETGIRSRYLGDIYDDQSLNTRIVLGDYLSGSLEGGDGSISHGELLGWEWQDIADVLGLDLAFPESDEVVLRWLREYLRTGEIPEMVVKPPLRRMEAVPTGARNMFADIAAESTPTVQTIPVGIGTRIPQQSGMPVSLPLYNTMGVEMTPAAIRRANWEGLKQWVRDPFGNFRVPHFRPDVERTLLTKGRGGFTPEQRRSYNRTIAEVRERQRMGTIGFDSPTPRQIEVRPGVTGDTLFSETPTGSPVPRIGTRAIREARSRLAGPAIGGAGGLFDEDIARTPEYRGETYRRSLAARMAEDELLRLSRQERPARRAGGRTSRAGSLYQAELDRLRRLTEDELSRMSSQRQLVERGAVQRNMPGALSEAELDRLTRLTGNELLRLRQLEGPGRAPGRRPPGGPGRQPPPGRTGRRTTGTARRTTTQPASRRTTGPVTRPTTRQITRPTTQPVSRRTTGPVTRPTTQPITRPTTQPVTRPTTQPVTRPTTQPVTRPTTRPTTQPVTRPTTRPTTRTTTPPRATTTPPPRITTTTPPRIVPPTFNLQDGLRLRRGEYPREVEWFQGDLRFTQDLITGNRQVEFVEHPHQGKPSETFRVIATSQQIPNEQRIDLGDTDVHISQQGIQFRPSKTLRSPREPRRQDRVFRQRRVRAGAF